MPEEFDVAYFVQLVEIYRLKRKNVAEKFDKALEGKNKEGLTEAVKWEEDVAAWEQALARTLECELERIGAITKEDKE